MSASEIMFYSKLRVILSNVEQVGTSCLLAVLLAGSLLGSGGASAADKSFIVTTEEWPPFVSAELPNKGWAMQVARAALEPQGYEVSLQLVPWARAVRCSRSGACDGLYLAYYTEERTEWYVFSEPFAKLRTGFFKLKDRDISFETLEDLRPYTIGITRGAAVSDAFDSADYLRKEEVVHDRQNAQKLLRGRVDLVVAAEPVFRHLIQTTLGEEHHDEFEFMSPHLSEQGLHMAISKQSSDYEQKLRDFNEGLARIRADGTYDEILRAHGF